MDEVVSVFHNKHKLDVKFGVGIGHGVRDLGGGGDVSLLKELVLVYGFRLGWGCFAPDGAGISIVLG